MNRKELKKSIKLVYNRVRRRLDSHASTALLLMGKEMSWRVANMPPNSDFRNTGFKVFSQWDEDGIIQYLISHLPIKHKTFIEFGVEDYEESNTRFLLLNDHWQGFVLDGSTNDIRYIQSDKIYWQFDLQAQQAWITTDNINSLIAQSGFAEDAGLLSIDIDGNDYWIWEAIHVVKPRIVVIEYNGLFGLEPISVPYAEDFQKLSAHYSGLYYGCSLAALHHLAKQRGYLLLGSNIWGHNAFFVRSDIASGFRGLEPEQAYIRCKYRESRDADGRLTYAREEHRSKLIQHMPVINVVSGQRGPLREFLQV
jgi:hypothetical protein